MRTAPSGRRTSLFIGTLSTLSRGNDLQPVPNDELTTTDCADVSTASRASHARYSERIETRKTSDAQARPSDHELPAEFSEHRVAPVRSVGSPVAGLDWRQKIKHRCNETKTFYVSRRSQNCLVGRRGVWRPCRNVKSVRVDRLSPACAKRYRPFLVHCKVRKVQTRRIPEDLQVGRGSGSTVSGPRP